MYRKLKKSYIIYYSNVNATLWLSLGIAGKIIKRYGGKKKKKAVVCHSGLVQHLVNWDFNGKSVHNVS